MKKSTHVIEYEVYASIEELTEQDRWLLKEARELTGLAYAPYSHFNVAAVARMSNGEVLNKSYKYPDGDKLSCYWNKLKKKPILL